MVQDIFMAAHKGGLRHVGGAGAVHTAEGEWRTGEPTDRPPYEDGELPIIAICLDKDESTV